MVFQENTPYKMTVKRIQYQNGIPYYVVSYEGKDYHVRKYPHQSPQKKEVICYFIGKGKHGVLNFVQDLTDVLYELYEEGCIYPFRVVKLKETAEGDSYILNDNYGISIEVKKKSKGRLRIGEVVQVEVLSITRKGLQVKILTKEEVEAFRNKEAREKEILRSMPLDFTKLNADKDTTLRDYQVNNKKQIYKAWETCRSVMLQMPTGTGKTRLFVSIARDIFDYGASIKRTFRVLILAHRKELIEQISEHLGQKYRLAHGLIISQNIEQKSYSMQVGSVPTLNRRLTRWEDKNFDVIIIDEAHHVKAKSYKKIIDMYPNAKILGVTATPYRLNGAGFRPEFDELIVSPSVAEFIKKKYLCEYDYYSIKPNSELQKEIDKMKLDFEGDYKESEMMDVMDRDYVRADILDTYLRFAKGKKGIVYTISRAHNVHLAEKFKEAGIISASIDSETPKEKRDELVSLFRRGEIQVLFNVNIFSEGFDCPDVEVIQLARPTKSLSMYLQQVGRGLRPAEGKERLIILDNVGLYNKFGFPSARRKWRYHFEGKPVDESPAAHKAEREEEREVKDIFEGSEEIEMLHSSTSEEIASSSLDVLSRNYRDSFISFATQELGASTAKGYAHIIDSIIDPYIRTHIDPSFKSIFHTVEIDELIRLRNALMGFRTYAQLNIEKHHRYSASLNKYIKFAESYKDHLSDEVDLPEIDDETESQSTTNNRLAFIVYLREETGSSAGVDEMVTAIEDIVDEAIRKHINPAHKTVFDLTNQAVLLDYSDLLAKNLSFANVNKLRGNKPFLALRKYIEFVALRENRQIGGEPTAKPQPSANQGSDSEIDAEIKELDRIIELLTKNNLPVSKEIKDKHASLIAKREALSLIPLIVGPIRKHLEEGGITDLLSFQYEGKNQVLNIESSITDASQLGDINEINSIITLMEKNHLVIPPDVLERKKTIERSKEQTRQVDQFKNWIKAYLKSIPQLRDYNMLIRYDPQSGLSFSTNDKRGVAEKGITPDKAFVLDTTPGPKIYGKALLRVVFDDGSVVDRGTATDIFIESVERIGIDRVKSLCIMMYGRPMISSTPHPNYQTQCKKLSNGDYLMCLSTTERKMQIINSIAAHFNLGIHAELKDTIKYKK